MLPSGGRPRVPDEQSVLGWSARAGRGAAGADAKRDVRVDGAFTLGSADNRRSAEGREVAPEGVFLVVRRPGKGGAYERVPASSTRWPADQAMGQYLR